MPIFFTPRASPTISAGAGVVYGAGCRTRTYVGCPTVYKTVAVAAEPTQHKNMEPTLRIELKPVPYQGTILPLDYIDSEMGPCDGIEPSETALRKRSPAIGRTRRKLGATYRNRNGAYSLARNRSATIPTSPRNLERSIGLEPIRRVWKTPMLPLHQHRSENYVVDSTVYVVTTSSTPSPNVIESCE
jgi:hypothetical protein